MQAPDERAVALRAPLLQPTSDRAVVGPMNARHRLFAAVHPKNN